MEFLDIIDEVGNLLGIKKSREESHKEGHLHQAVHVWIYNSKGEILIQKRAKEKDAYADLWDAGHAGHVTSGETPISTAIKEIKEELGINLTEDSLKLLKTFRFEDKIPENNWHDNELNYIYLLKHDGSTEDMILQDEEVSEVKFISPDILEEHINSPSGREEYCPHGDFSYYNDIIKQVKEELELD